MSLEHGVIQHQKQEEFLKDRLTKIQAFTLGELLAVMVISSIVVTLSFLALSNVQRQMRIISQVFERQQKISHLERIITVNFQRSEASYKQGNSIILNSAGDTAVYNRNLGKIIYKKDTLDIHLKEMIFYYEGNKVTNGIFDALEFSFDDTYGEKGFFLYKHNDASHYMND